MNATELLLGSAALARHGERTALVCEGREVSYRALAEEVQRAAGALDRLGVRPGDRVLLLLRDTPRLAAAWLGAVHAGAVAIALNTRLAEDEYRRLRAESRARLVIVEDVYAHKGPALAAELAREGLLAVAGEAPGAWPSWDAALAAAPPVRPAQPVAETDPAFWLYSSGTTGRAKAIVHSHRDVAQAGRVYEEVLGLPAGARVLATSKLFFAYGLDHGLLGPLRLGLCSVLLPDWPEPAEVADALAGTRPLVLASVPSLYRRLAQLEAERAAALAQVSHFLSAGERVPEALAARWRELTGREILSIYGMSETFAVCMITPPGTPGDARPGRPLGGVEVRLVGQDGSAAADGQIGVLWVRHPALSTGYANAPEETARRYVKSWFCTNDLFVRDAHGLYHHCGRSDELLKIAGQFVQPSEIEAAVAGLPEIAEAACVAIADGEGFERLALAVLPQTDAQAAVRAAERACAEQLPRHKRPRWVCALSEFPRTATGKLQRYRLREILAREFGTGP